MLSKRSNKKELVDNLSLSSDELRKNISEWEMLNNWFGRKNLLKTALNKIYNRYSNFLKSQRIKIADLGCGGGDLTSAINDWAISKRLNIKIVGIDANPAMVRYASETSGTCNNIQYKVLDIFLKTLTNCIFDIITISSFVIISMI